MSILPTPYPTVARFFGAPQSLQHAQHGAIYPEAWVCPAWVFYGQQGEDLDVFVDFFREKKLERGVFVEIGAGNGIEFSNTHFFEKCLQWTGVLVEPNPSFEPLLRSVRENSYIASCVAGKEAGEASFAIHPDLWAQSHRTDVNSAELQERLGKNSEMEIVTVPTRPLGDILAEANVSYVDFMSIDVEGSELEVLEGMDWEIPVHVIVIECQEGVCPATEARVEQCRSILQQNGFTFHKVVGGNEVWKNEDYPSNRESYLQ